jgi:hypothetical protein
MEGCEFNQKRCELKILQKEKQKRERQFEK